MLFGSVSDVSGSDLEKVDKSRSRILNEGLGVSAGLGFYHSIPLLFFLIEICCCHILDAPRAICC